MSKADGETIDHRIDDLQRVKRKLTMAFLVVWICGSY
jgi:hypothetical protein